MLWEILLIKLIYQLDELPNQPPRQHQGPADTPPRPQERRPRPQSIWERGALPKWLSLPPFTKKKITGLDARAFVRGDDDETTINLK